jgi:ubiquitin C-terminal hydrolase
MQVRHHSRSFPCNGMTEGRGGQIIGEIAAFTSSLNEKDGMLATLWNDLLLMLLNEYTNVTNKAPNPTSIVDNPWWDSSIIDSILDLIPRGGGVESGRSSNHRRDENGDMIHTGLVNMGNTCYLNAQLQCAYHIPYVRQLVLDARDEVVQVEVEVEEEIDEDEEIVAQRDGMEEVTTIDDKFKEDTDIDAHLPIGAVKSTKTIKKKVVKEEVKSITDALHGLQITFKSLDNNSPYSMSGNTDVLCRTLGIDPYVQQDGQEFWKLFIPEIEYDKLANLYSGHYEDYVREILPDTEIINQEESSITVNDDYGEEKKEEVEFIPAKLEVKKNKAQERISTVVFSDLSIPVTEGTGGSVESALREMFTEPEILRVSEGNGWRPSKSAEKVDAYKGFSLQRDGLPAILQLHLKRFKYDYDTGETSKINDRCSFPLELDLSELADLDREDDEGSNDIYDLQSIVIHKGDYGSGHYYSYVRPDIHLDEWYRFDDEFVTRVDYSDVIADAYGGNNALLQRKRPRSDSFESIDSNQHEVQQQRRGLLRRIFSLFGLFRHVQMIRSRTPERRGGFGYGGRTSNAYMIQYVHRSDVPKLYP